MSDTTFNWYDKKVNLVIERKTGQSLTNVALRIEERTKVNINQAPGASGQGLIDTGFLLNSTYVVSPNKNTYDQANQTGTYKNRAGEDVQRNLVPRQKLKPGFAMVLVAVGADYAIYQEIEHSFFYRAIEETSKELKGLIETF